MRDGETCGVAIIGLESVGDVYVVPDDAPMHHGRKLRDALLLAGTSSTVRSTATVEGVEVITEATYGPAPKNLDQRNDRHGIMMDDEWCRRRHIDPVSGETFEAIEARELLAKSATPRRTLAQSVGKFMAWMFGIPALLLACFAIGHSFGWWV